MTSHSPARRWLAGIALATSLAFTAACGVGQSDDSSDSNNGGDTTSQSESDDAGTEADAETDAETDADAGDGSFTAGTYEATGGYTSPGGEQEVGVEVTIDADGTITDVVVTPEATDSTSDRYQTQFAGGIADEIVGENIDDLDVSVVAGSSLTSGGFNAAIEDIIAEAQA